MCTALTAALVRTDKCKRDNNKVHVVKRFKKLKTQVHKTNLTHQYLREFEKSIRLNIALKLGEKS